ncbi:MAG: HugZ family protein, partial [Alphaproteobacteria bacterium]|nr:HugZ family protein [Alphaproteobacteria bacterium]
MGDQNPGAGEADGRRPQQKPGELPPGYDGLAEAKRLLRSIRAGALATLGPDGFPFASLVNVATDFDGAPILLLSGLSGHTKHLLADRRASLLLAETGKGDPLAHPRLSVTGEAIRCEDETRRAGLKARFLARHPKSALYADFGDFSFWWLEMARANLNGGFARAAEYTAEQLRTDTSQSAALLALEADALEHMNADHAQAVQLYATSLLGEAQGRWRATGIDPDGLDLAAGERTARLAFPHRVNDGAGLSQLLAELA